jgi:hypothetical protein
MSGAPEVNLTFVKKHGAFILKHDYMTIIIDSIVEYFRYNSHEEYDSLIQTIKDQAYSFLKSANSRTYGDGESVDNYSGVISIWNDEEHRVDSLLIITLTRADTDADV